jgi:hypothetical protein
VDGTLGMVVVAVVSGERDATKRVIRSSYSPTCPSHFFLLHMAGHAGQHCGAAATTPPRRRLKQLL